MAFRSSCPLSWRLLGVLASLAIVMATLGSIPAGIARASTQPTTLFTAHSAHSFQVRPGTIFFGVDVGLIFGGRRRPGKSFGHIGWQRWGEASASGAGIEWVNDCRPNCAQGTWKNRGVIKLHAWRPVYHHFTRLSANGPHIHETLVLKHKGGSWYWK